jgi:hypothetical protein
MTKEHFIELWNTFQHRYLVWWAYGLAIIEIIDVILRSRFVQIKVDLVSMVARRVAFSGLTAFSFFFGSMAVHWFVTWRRLPWEGVTEAALGVFFWLVFVAYILASWFDPTPKYWPVVTQWLRYPPIAAVVGAVLAYVCFPQRSVWFPGKIPS